MIVSHSKCYKILTLTAENSSDIALLKGIFGLIHYPQKDPLDVKIATEQEARLDRAATLRHQSNSKSK